MNLEQALQTFFDESFDLLAQMEYILLDAEAESTTEEQLNALFRTMHTIKGSAGLFGLDGIVSFTHQVENVLDQLREGKLKLNDQLTGLLLRSHDHVKAMLNGLAAKESLDELLNSPLQQELVDYVQSITKPAEKQKSIAVPAVQPTVALSAATAGTPTNTPPQWLLSLRFGADILRNGMDPSSFIRYLNTLGQIEKIEAVTSNLPTDNTFNPETNYLRLELLYRADIRGHTLLEVFEFIREDSEIYVWPLADAARHWSQATLSATVAEADEVRRIWQSFGIALPDSEIDTSIANGSEEAGNANTDDLGMETAQHPASSRQNGKSGQNRQTESKIIKVEASKLDVLINLIGELVIAGAAANLMARRSQQSALVESTVAIANLIEQIRAGTLSMRMIQIGEIFSRFPRVVRDISRELDKDILLHISGAETELDKSMVDKLGEPLMHIVRNAMDHGIESSEERIAHGKPSAGNIWLNAYHESGSIVIEVADDGAGLDQARILAKAIERGLLPADTKLSEQEIFRQIFEPGFSTSERITNLSGRGVGMDVVKKSIEQLRGTIDIESQAHLGTCFRIRLPLTLAIIDGFLVEVGGATFVLPLDTVIECLELPPSLQQDGIHDSLNLRGELLPMLHLTRFLELPDNPVKRKNVVVVSYGDRKAGLVVDALLGEFQTVIKPLGALFQHLKAISGSTILGTGEVALIMDVAALIQHASQKEAEHFSLSQQWKQLRHNSHGNTSHG
ncbi:chemotaxis protein CheA [Neisseriaceae bacterium TC5R-5]|nr:chemotaxis protein CheA [Neisseriaceae bacterium TC5R-5]